MNKLTPYIASASISLASCGGQVTENHDSPNYPDANILADADTTDSAEDSDIADSGPDSALDEDAGDSAITETQYLTRSQFAHALKELMLESYNPYYRQCFAPATDIDPETELCRDVELLQQRGVLENFANNEFRPDYVMTNQEVWDAIVNALQWTPVLEDCVTSLPDYQPSQWFNAYAGAICEKGIHVAQRDGTLSAQANTTISYWNDLHSELYAYQTGTATRADIAEIAGHNIMDIAPDPDTPLSCDSTIFSDVPSDTLTCYYVQQLAPYGFLDTSLPEFRPDETVILAEISKMYANALRIDNECTGCTGFDCIDWYTSYMDAICETGYTQLPVNPSETLSRRKATYMAWDLRLRTAVP
jgi:hypothetical protein